jgi:hypothetical protein
MPCVFCGNVGKLHAEHAWPRWIRHELPELAAKKGKRFRGSTASLYEIDQAAFGVKVKCTCETCQTGWMEDLESIARPLLRNMLKGRNRSLRPVGQRIVATWVFKTTLMMREAAREPHDVDLSTQFRYIHDYIEPPLNAMIWVARAETADNFPDPAFRYISQGSVVADMVTELGVERVHRIDIRGHLGPESVSEHRSVSPPM